MKVARPPRKLVYAQVSAERLVLRRVNTGETVEDDPRIAFDGRGNPVAFGRAAEDAARWHPDVRIANGFSHPRCVLGDMDAAIRALHHLLLRLLNPRGKRWTRKPEMIIHPVGVTELSGVEAWGLQRVAQLAGARSARIWLGEEPAYETLLRGTAQASGAFLAIDAPRD
jgi:hypothetical protein